MQPKKQKHTHIHTQTHYKLYNYKIPYLESLRDVKTAWTFQKCISFFAVKRKSERRILTDDGDLAGLGDFTKLVARYYLVLAIVLSVSLHHKHLGFTGRRRVRHLPVLTRLELGRIVDEPRHRYRLWTGDFQHEFDLLELINRLRNISQRPVEILSSVAVYFLHVWTGKLGCIKWNWKRGNVAIISVLTRLESAQNGAGEHGSTFHNSTLSDPAADEPNPTHYASTLF